MTLKKIVCPYIQPSLIIGSFKNFGTVSKDLLSEILNGNESADRQYPLSYGRVIQFQNCCSTVTTYSSHRTEQFIGFYLDGTIAGDHDSVLRDFKIAIEECGKTGLRIYPDKCE